MEVVISIGSVGAWRMITARRNPSAHHDRDTAADTPRHPWKWRPSASICTQAAIRFARVRGVFAVCTRHSTE
jgi:hypothetical protein